MSTALVIGAGPAGLMAAEVLATAGHSVTVADQMPSVGRKFLMAGKSGLNLTKDEPLHTFLDHFGDAPPAFRDAVTDFGPDAVQQWARDLGQPVFTGSTGRVFPTAMKASPLLRAWLVRLDQAGVALRTRTRWKGWQDGQAVFETPDGPLGIAADVTILAMGGASWARLGSDGAWADHLPGTAPFKPANCGFSVQWTHHMAPFYGTPVKATCLRAGQLTSRGEWVITKRGIEGGGVYTVSAAVRDGAALQVDLLPDLSLENARNRVTTPQKKRSRSEILRKGLRLSPVKAALFNELTQGLSLQSAGDIAAQAKSLVLTIEGPFSRDEAISTAGGVRFGDLDDGFMIRNRPGVFVAGEMLDWEAPTGGYLLTACLATGRAAGTAATAWVNSKR